MDRVLATHHHVSMQTARRTFLTRTSALLASVAVSGGHPSASAASSNKPFDARSLKEALADAGLADAAAHTEIQMEVPELADNAASLPIQISTALPGTRAMAVFIDRNPFPYIARFTFHRAAPYASFRARIAETSPVRVVAITERGSYTVQKQVQAAAGGCAADDAEAPLYPDPPPPVKARARLDGQGGAELRVLLTHPMENGLRKAPGGLPIAERFIERFSVRINEEQALTAEFGRSMSRDPFLAFRLLQIKAGDRVELRWQDSAGAARVDEVKLA